MHASSAWWHPPSTGAPPEPWTFLKMGKNYTGVIGIAIAVSLQYHSNKCSLQVPLHHAAATPLARWSSLDTWRFQGRMPPWKVKREVEIPSQSIWWNPVLTEILHTKTPLEMGYDTRKCSFSTVPLGRYISQVLLSARPSWLGPI